MFLIKFRQHNRNLKFDKILKIIRINNVTNDIINILYKRYYKFNIYVLINRFTTFMSLKINVKNLII